MLNIKLTHVKREIGIQFMKRCLFHLGNGDFHRGMWWWERTLKWGAGFSQEEWNHFVDRVLVLMKRCSPYIKHDGERAV